MMIPIRISSIDHYLITLRIKINSVIVCSVFLCSGSDYYCAGRAYVQEVRYSGFAGAKTGYVEQAKAGFLMLLVIRMAVIAESLFLSLRKRAVE
jgi:hypothetical protein